MKVRTILLCILYSIKYGELQGMKKAQTIRIVQLYLYYPVTNAN